MKILWFFVATWLMHSVSCKITYQLYSKLNKNMGQPLLYKNMGTVSRSNFNAYKKHKMLIHGYNQNGRSDFNRNLKNALLNHEDYNVIVVDWSDHAGPTYNAAVKNVQAVGIEVAKFVDWLDLHEGFVHLIGFDLGAHVAGFAGKNTQNGRIDKITGLDPNRVGFNPNQSGSRLSAGDARFVEALHSNGGKIGMMQHVVHADKYINDGKTQPGCTTNQCSHLVAVEVYTAQVDGKKYPTYTCKSLEELDGRGCGFLPGEWFNENTGLQQIITTSSGENF